MFVLFLAPSFLIQTSEHSTVRGQFSTTNSSAPAALLFVEPETLQGTTGQDLTLNVSVSNVTDLYGWEFYLGWNSSLLSLVSVNEGPFLMSGGNTYFTYYLNTTSTDEHVVVDCTLEGQIPGVNGIGTLATVTFNVTNAGQCPLNLYNVDLRDSSDTEIPSQAVGGQFSTPVVEIPNSVIFLVFIVLTVSALVLSRKMSKKVHLRAVFDGIKQDLLTEEKA